VRKPGSIGTPIEGVEMRLVDEKGQTVPDGEIGEIAIRGHNVMKGYWNKPEATAEAIPDGWFRTGDMVKVDSDGYYYIVDRKKDLIIRGGYNVYPREIEEVLHEHPAVAEVAVIGIPHADLGEEVGAAVALKPGASATPEELRSFVKSRVAAYKYPRRVRLAGELARRPGFVGRQAGSLATELGRVALGRSSVAANPRDRRFADPAWKDNPFLRRAVQAYLAAAASAAELVDGAELDWRDDTRLKFLLTNLVAAASPSNNPLLAPAGWKALLDTGGENAVRGLRNLASDLATSPRVPSMVPAGSFEVGKDLAVTPGGVVHATDQFELIQYQPVTESVYRYPLLIVPPMINKYYIVGLAPGRSMVEFLVASGHQVFVMSWRNPDARHRDW